jgi:hypothetical protein
MWVGARARQDKLLFTQLWGDSLLFDFESLGNVDVFWVDGAHDYMHVRHDTLSGMPMILGLFGLYIRGLFCLRLYTMSLLPRHTLRYAPRSLAQGLYLR